MTPLACLFLTGCSTMAFDEAADALKAERKKLNGTWVIVSSERELKTSPGAGDVWVIEDDKAKCYFEGRPSNIKPEDWKFKIDPKRNQTILHLTIDPTKSPKTWDEKTEYKDKTMSNTTLHAIYKVDDTTLTICYQGYYDKGKLPKEFKTIKDNDRRITTFKHMKK